MAELIVKHPHRAAENLPLDRLRMTIGRSARNDVCIADPFASRVHAEVRREGDRFVLRDLNSANGTFYNGQPVAAPVTLAPGGCIQIGETDIIFSDADRATISGATMIADAGTPFFPTGSIAVSSAHRTTSGLLQEIQGAQSEAQSRGDSSVRADRNNLLALIGKVGVTLLDSASLDETLRQIVTLVFESVPADRCLIALREDETSELTVRVARQRGREGEAGEFRLSRGIIEEVIGRGNSVLTSDAQHDPRFTSGTMSILGIRSVLAVPLGVGDKVFGLVYADSPMADAMFSQDHLKVLTTLASVAAIRVENARLLEERLDRERMERELALAREIQQRFQPSSAPQLKGCEIEGISFPCNEIGGDYYDFIARENGKVLIALGDVSGKGTAAALLMSSLHAAVHAQVALQNSLADTMAAVNRYLAESIPANRFVTFFCAELDVQTNVLTYINAGHNPPFIARADGTILKLPAGSLPLGISPNVQFTDGRMQLQAGDLLVIYSDGVSETNNRRGEEFGEARLHEVVLRNMQSSAAGLRDRIESALTQFAQGTPAADDITLVIVKVSSEQKAVSGEQ